MRDFITPTRMPVEGNVRKEQTPTLPEMTENQKNKLSSFYEEIIRGARQAAGEQTNIIRPTIDPSGTLLIASVPDSTDYVLLGGNISIEGEYQRRLRPLYIIIDGMCTLRKSTRVEGLIAVTASDEMTVECGASLSHTLIVSRNSIHLLPSSILSGQCIAPSITVDSGAIVRYPSLVLSIPEKTNDGMKREILLRGSAKIDGSLILLSCVNTPTGEDIITISPQSTVTGFVRSDNLMTLDGNVHGMVQTKDFYFYQSPTKYYGWLRSGRIDRTILPSGYLLPPLLINRPKYEVLEWL
jgi:cytoskeletal protein CcmA (bactofilin family)